VAIPFLLIAAWLLRRPLFHRKAPRAASAVNLANATSAEEADSQPVNRQLVPVRSVFDVENPSDWSMAKLQLKAPASLSSCTLNGQPFAAPVQGMVCESLEGVPGRLLRPGQNVFEAYRSVDVTGAASGVPPQAGLTPSARTIALTASPQSPQDLVLHTGPIVCATGPDSFTVTCRTNLPAKVVLRVGEKVLASTPAGEMGFIHRFRVDGLTPGTEYSYALEAACDGGPTVSSGPHSVRTYPESGPFDFVLLGDSRDNVPVWHQLSLAAKAIHPLFVIHTGDLVAHGRQDSLWDPDFWEPARDLLADVPFYAASGNHEGEAPLFNYLFALPEGADCRWTQRACSTFFVCIDTNPDWQAGSEPAVWLEKVLSESKDPFLFVVGHHPPISSGHHGPSPSIERVVLPMLLKYHVTAMLVGHDHDYERLEPGGGNGPSIIVSGGGGAELRAERKKVPTSKVFVETFNYVTFKVSDSECSMRAFTPEGKELDKRTWRPREEAAAK
jgi:hypothetical protein